MGRTKRFAKKDADVRHFRLVGRSTRDPRCGDANANDLVLEPFVSVNVERKKPELAEEARFVPESLVRAIGAEQFGVEARGEEFDDLDAESCGDDESMEADDDAAIQKRLEELDGDCYFPKDGYNYERHLRKTGTTSGEGTVTELKAPDVKDGSAFPVLASEVEEKKAQAQVQISTEEEEMLRALDFAEEYEEADDDLFEALLPGGVEQDPREVLWGSSAVESEALGLPDLAKLRAEHRALLGERDLRGAHPPGDDDESGDEPGPCAPPSADHGRAAVQLDQLLCEEYGDDDIGGIEEEDIEGGMNLEDCEGLLDEYLDGKVAEQEKFRAILEPIVHKDDQDDTRVIDETRAIIQKHYLDDDGEDTASGDEESVDESRKWDCESVLSTLSNVSNRPGKIGRIKVLKKPRPEVLKEDLNAEARAEASETDDDVVELPDVCTERPKDETPEQKKARKAAVKESRRICRSMKKESKETYKAEALRLPAQGTKDIRPGTRYQRI